DDGDESARQEGRDAQRGNGPGAEGSDRADRRAAQVARGARDAMTKEGTGMRGPTAMTPNRLALGLALGLTLTAVAGRLLVDRALDQVEHAAATRSAIIGIQGVVAAVESGDLDEGDLGRRLAELDASDAELSSLRVIRFAGLRLLAS